MPSRPATPTSLPIMPGFSDGGVLSPEDSYRATHRNTRRIVGFNESSLISSKLSMLRKGPRPAEGIYTSLEAAKTAISLHSMSAGYALVIGKNDIKKGRRVIQMNCKRFGKEKARINEEYRRRHRYTVKCECLFYQGAN